MLIRLNAGSGCCGLGKGSVYYLIPLLNIRKGTDMAGEIIRLGDPTSHGGKVLEGSLMDICHGKPIAFVGHQTHCPKCRGTFPIIEGAPVTTFYGKGVALAGMKTACGAVLIATQMTDIVELGGSTAPGRAGASNIGARTIADSEQPESTQPTTLLPTDGEEPELEQYFEVVDATGAHVDVVYRINAGKKELVQSTLPHSGSTQAFPVDQETELVFWKAPR